MPVSADCALWSLVRPLALHRHSGHAAHKTDREPGGEGSKANKGRERKAEAAAVLRRRSALRQDGQHSKTSAAYGGWHEWS